MPKNIDVSGSGLADRLVHLRRARNQTQAEFAEASGVAVRTIRNIENGQSRVQEWTLMQIAAALEMSFHELVGQPPAVGNGGNGNGHAAATVDGNGPGREAVSDVPVVASGHESATIPAERTEGADEKRVAAEPAPAAPADRGPTPRPADLTVTWIAAAAALALVVFMAMTHPGPAVQPKPPVLPLPLDSELVHTVRTEWQSEHEAAIMCASYVGFGDAILYGLGPSGADAGEVVCRSVHDGAVLWTDRLSAVEIEQAFGSEWVHLPFGAHMAARGDLDGKGDYCVAVLSNHRTHYPSAIRLFDSQGRLGAYFNFGHTTWVCAHDLDGDECDEFLVSGTNNGEAYQNGTLIRLDEVLHSGASVDALSTRNPGLADSSEIRVVLPPFPPAVMAQLRDSRFTFKKVRIHGSPPVLVADLVADRRNLLVTLDADLHVIDISMSDNFAKMVESWPDSVREVLSPEFFEEMARNAYRYGGAR